MQQIDRLFSLACKTAFWIGTASPKLTVFSIAQNQSLADLDNLPEPDELAADIIENLQSALESFQELQAQLKK